MGKKKKKEKAKWKPDKEFVKFLEWMEKRGSVYYLHGRRVLDEIKKCTEFGRRCYVTLRNLLYTAYQSWKNLPKKDR